MGPKVKRSRRWARRALAAAAGPRQIAGITDPELLAAARGDRPADVLLAGGRVANVFTAEWEKADLALAGGVVVGVGPGYEANTVVDVRDAFLLPGFVDPHVHIESSLCAPAEFARAVLPRGTTTVVCDPHEIANVHGAEGVRWMLDASEGLPLDVRPCGTEVVADPERGLLKIAVLERHTGSGRVGLGLVAGMGLRRGAIAGTVAHDHHNLIAVGADDASMRTAAAAVAGAGGGLAVADGATVLALLPLPVGGLVSTAPIEEVRAGLDAVVAAARGLGSPLHDPFMAMSFLGLEVIPSLKITDRGLVDVEAFRPVELWV